MGRLIALRRFDCQWLNRSSGSRAAVRTPSALPIYETKRTSVAEPQPKVGNLAQSCKGRKKIARAIRSTKSELETISNDKKPQCFKAFDPDYVLEFDTSKFEIVSDFDIRYSNLGSNLGGSS
jgi:hypothetical protein